MMLDPHFTSEFADRLSAITSSFPISTWSWTSVSTTEPSSISRRSKLPRTASLLETWRQLALHEDTMSSGNVNSWATMWKSWITNPRARLPPQSSFQRRVRETRAPPCPLCEARGSRRRSVRLFGLLRRGSRRRSVRLFWRSVRRISKLLGRSRGRSDRGWRRWTPATRAREQPPTRVTVLSSPPHEIPGAPWFPSYRLAAREGAGDDGFSDEREGAGGDSDSGAFGRVFRPVLKTEHRLRPQPWCTSSTLEIQRSCPARWRCPAEDVTFHDEDKLAALLEWAGIKQLSLFQLLFALRRATVNRCPQGTSEVTQDGGLQLSLARAASNNDFKHDLQAPRQASSRPARGSGGDKDYSWSAAPVSKSWKNRWGDRDSTAKSGTDDHRRPTQSSRGRGVGDIRRGRDVGNQPIRSSPASRHRRSRRRSAERQQRTNHSSRRGRSRSEDRRGRNTPSSRRSRSRSHNRSGSNSRATSTDSSRGGKGGRRSGHGRKPSEQGTGRALEVRVLHPEFAAAWDTQDKSSGIDRLRSFGVSNGETYGEYIRRYKALAMTVMVFHHAFKPSAVQVQIAVRDSMLKQFPVVSGQVYKDEQLSMEAPFGRHASCLDDMRDVLDKCAFAHMPAVHGDDFFSVSSTNAKSLSAVSRAVPSSALRSTVTPSWSQGSSAAMMSVDPLPNDDRDPFLLHHSDRPLQGHFQEIYNVASEMALAKNDPPLLTPLISAEEGRNALRLALVGGFHFDNKGLDGEAALRITERCDFARSCLVFWVLLVGEEDPSAWSTPACAWCPLFAPPPFDDKCECASDDVLLFWKPPSVFSQWTPSAFDVLGVRYSCGDQFMMSEKAMLFGDMTSYDKIMAATVPKTHKFLGRNVRPFDHAEWERRHEEIVLTGSCAKFAQNHDMKHHLMETVTRLLAEASPFDRVWGIGMSACFPETSVSSKWAASGKNLLGKALMEVRRLFRDHLLSGENFPASNSPTPPISQPPLHGHPRIHEVATATGCAELEPGVVIGVSAAPLLRVPVETLKAAPSSIPTGPHHLHHHLGAHSTFHISLGFSFSCHPQEGRSVRITVNYKRLNALVDWDGQPLPRVDGILDSLYTGKVFSIFDLNSAFHQIVCDEDTVPLTAFCTPTQLFEWLRMPQGANASPSWFVKVIKRVVHGLERVLAYLDDVICFDEEPLGHVLSLIEFSKRLRQYNLKLSPGKARVGATHANFLGHTISLPGVGPDGVEAF
ncbi:unnamed protein product [Ectocarpus sp. CCAP 1310/34]|nr:unnamed protein product [Ectocarpus sp. CCAP 1310/34]